MDSQDQNPEAQQSQPPKPISQLPKDASLQHESKILQPSQAFVQEMQQSSIDSSPSSQNPPSPASPIARPKQNIGSLYPEATHGSAAAIDLVTANNEDMKNKTASDAANSKKTKIIIMAVMIFGAVMVVLSATSLITWIRIVKLPGLNSTVNIIALILSAAELLLGLGILMRREGARAMYVALALVLFVFSLYSTYNYYKYIRKADNLQKVAIANENVAITNEKASTEQTIKQYQNNTSIPATQKSQIIQELQKSEAESEAASEAAKTTEQQTVSKFSSTLAPLLEGYVVAVLPLIFLTRPSVKAVFE